MENEELCSGPSYSALQLITAARNIRFALSLSSEDVTVAASRTTRNGVFVDMRARLPPPKTYPAPVWAVVGCYATRLED